jgi:hypothetical protein
MQPSGNINNELLNWLNQVYKEEARSKSLAHKIVLSGVTIFGAGIGIASACIMYLLSAEFGGELSAKWGIEDSHQVDTIKNFLGLTAAIPMAALSAINMKDGLAALANYLAKPKPTIRSIFKKKSTSELVTRGFFAVASPFSAIPQSTLTWNYISNPGARVFCTACATIGPTFFNGRGAQHLIDSCKSKDSAVLEVEHYLQKCYQLLEKMPANAFSAFLQQNSNEVGELVQDFIPTLFGLTEVGFSPKKSKSAKTIFLLIGGLLGLISAIIFYQLSLEGVQEPLQIKSPALQYIFSSLSYLLNAALSSLATISVFDILYQSLFGKEDNSPKMTWSKLRKLFTVVAIFMGFFAALPLGSLQISNAQSGSILQKLLIGPTFLGPMCVRSKALYELLNRCLDVMVNLVKKNVAQDSGRVACLLMIKEFAFSVQDMRLEVVNFLRGMIEVSQPMLDMSIRNKV